MAVTETVGSLAQWMPSAVEAETSSRCVCLLVRKTFLLAYKWDIVYYVVSYSHLK